MNSRDVLHSAWIQDAVEFLMAFVVPFNNQKIKSTSDLLEDI
jgi:hypothetical protein